MPEAIIGRKDYEYKEHFRLFTDYSDEKQLLREAVMHYFQPSFRQTFLDGGAGDGAITIPKAKKVAKTIAIEPNTKFAEHLQANGIIVLPQKIQETPLTETFNLILMSHALYYIPYPLWYPTITNLYQHLIPKGKMCLIVFGGRGDWHDLHESFFKAEGFTVEQPDVLVLNLAKNGITVTRKDVETHYELPLEQAITFISYFLNVPEKRKEEFRQRLQAKTTNGICKINAYHTLLMMEKP